MQLSVRQVNRLTSLIYSAVLDASRWRAFLKETSRVMSGAKTHIFGHDLASNTQLGLITHGYSQEFIDSYEAHYGQLNMWATGFAQAEPGEPLFAAELCARDVLEKSEFYNDWVLPQDDILAGGGTILFKEEERTIVFGGNIRRRDEHLEDDWMQLVRLITPHLRQAFEINRALASLTLGQADQVQRPRRRASAVLAINGNGRLVFSNATAERMLEQGGAVRLSIGRRLWFTAAKAAAHLSEALDELRCGGLRIPRVFKITLGPSLQRYRCRLAALDPNWQGGSPLRLWMGQAEPSLLVTISPEDDPSMDMPSRLSRLYNLTDQEAKVSCLLRAGMTLREISDTRGVSIHTTRNQVKSVMSKMGVRRQLDLVRLLEQAT